MVACLNEPGVGVNAPILNEIKLVKEVTVIDGPTSSNTIPRRRETELQHEESRCHECVIKKASSTPKFYK